MLNLLVTVVWIFQFHGKEIAMAQQVAVKVFMNTFDGLGALVLQYHAHIFDITRKKKNTVRNKQTTWETQIV